MSNIKLNIPEIKTTTARLVSACCENCKIYTTSPTLRWYEKFGLQTIEIKAIRVRLLRINRPVCSKTTCEIFMCVNVSTGLIKVNMFPYPKNNALDNSFCCCSNCFASVPDLKSNFNIASIFEM